MPTVNGKFRELSSTPDYFEANHYDHRGRPVEAPPAEPFDLDNTKPRVVFKAATVSAPEIHMRSQLQEDMSGYDLMGDEELGIPPEEFRAG